MVEKWEVTLRDPDVAEDDKGNSGWWTMVYDEGFEFRLNGRVFFAFSKYVPKTPESLHKDDVDDYVSVCGETLVGWFHNVDGSHWGCFHARQIEGGASGKNAARAPHGHYTSDHVVAPSSLLETAARAAATPEELARRAFEADHDFVARHNAAPVPAPWSAAVHHDFHAGRSAAEAMRLLGYRPRGSPAAADALLELAGSGDTRTRHRHAHHRHRPKARVDNRPDHEKYAGLPANFDWRNVRGVNYDSRVVNQGDCGSCFAAATMSAAEARIRVASKGKDTTLLSTQAVVSCSVYNQGCDGGYPYLVAKHGEDFGFVPEACMAYSGNDEPCALRKSAGCPDPDVPQVYMVSNYSYIGGHYGACSEVEMMREIHRAGPIMVAFDAPSSLFYYSGGIFTGAAPPHEGPTLPGVGPWEKTNHAVVAVGWGVSDKGEKYWVIKNTWGKQWGERGYFRIRRGTDECGIESMAVTLSI